MLNDDSNFMAEDIYPRGQFIETTHVKYLQSAGARVVPIDWQLDDEKTQQLLSQINGVYIPGDSKSLIQKGNFQFTQAVRRILKWAQHHNEKESSHFPILGVGYGALAMLKSQMVEARDFTPFTPRGKLQLNLAHDPKHTYLFDEYEKDELENILDKVKFFSDVELGLTMSDMILEHKSLSNIFMPVGTYDDGRKQSQNLESVASFEGVVYPWFGVTYRIDRIQFSMESRQRDKTDHSREAVLHAQKVANLFVDEARLSRNQFTYVTIEKDYLNLINGNDAVMMEVPLA